MRAMQPNPILEKLGFSESDRLVILHADDIGMCQATLTAFLDLTAFGTVTSGSVMVPCPWFPAAAALSRDHPELDLGVHLTLNAEWDAYRWGPVSTRDPGSGLIDSEGYFHRTVEAVGVYADPEAVALEMRSQAMMAQAAGIHLTHFDTHMGTIAYPQFFPAYVQTALEMCLPAMIPRAGAAGLDILGIHSMEAASLAPILEGLEQQGQPLIDGLMALPLDQPLGQLEIAKKLLACLPAGITHFILHPAVDTPELRAICPDWRSRVANYQTFMSPEIDQFMRELGIHRIGYRSLRGVIGG